MQADLQKFKNALVYAHPDLYSNISPDEFEHVYQELFSKITVPLSAIRFYIVVLQLISSLHDGHSQVFATNQLRSYINKQGILPFHFLVQNERIFITRNMSEKQIADGSEVIAINGVLSNSIINELLLDFGGDGLCKNCIEYRFGSSYHSFYRVYPLIFGFGSFYKFTVRDYKTNSIQTVEVPAISNGDFRTKEKNRYGNNLHAAGIEEVLAQKAFNLEIKGNVAYMKVSRFFKDDFEEPANTYPDLYREAFRQIQHKKVKSLVIDLRGNGGGIGSNAAALVQYLTTKTFVPTKEMSLRGNDQYYFNITKDSLYLDNYFKLRKDNNKYLVTNTDSLLELKEFAPVNEYAFRGQVFVLIDGGSLSAAGAAAGMLKENTNAIFAGEETGGYAGISNGIRQLSIVGDSTSITINFPLIHSDFNVIEQLKKRGTVPDYWIAGSIHDIIRKRDAVKDFVMKELAK
jgi:hypothetical protein